MMHFSFILAAILAVQSTHAVVGGKTSPTFREDMNESTQKLTRELRPQRGYGTITESQDLSKRLLAGEEDFSHNADSGCFGGICKFVKRIFRRGRKIKANGHDDLPVFDSIDGPPMDNDHKPISVSSDDVIDDSPTWSTSRSSLGSISSSETSVDSGKKKRTKRKFFK